MIVKIRDDIGTTAYTDVAQIVPISKNEWSIMFTDFSERKVNGELAEVIMEGF